MGLIRTLLSSAFVAAVMVACMSLDSPVHAQRATATDGREDFLRQLQQIKVEVNARADESAAAANQVQCDREECERLAKEMRTLYDRFINRLETTPQAHKPAETPTTVPSVFTPEVRLYTASWCVKCPVQKSILDASGIQYTPIPYEAGLPGGMPQVWISRPDGSWRFFHQVVPASSVQAEIDAAKQQPASLPPVPSASPGGDASAGEVLSPDQQPTSIEEVRRVLQLLRPRPDETFVVNWGCEGNR